jgi:hypothetical protein
MREAIEYVREVVECDGPYDGIIGFSQVCVSVCSPAAVMRGPASPPPKGAVQFQYCTDARFSPLPGRRCRCSSDCADSSSIPVCYLRVRSPDPSQRCDGGSAGAHDWRFGAHRHADTTLRGQKRLVL